MARVLESNDLGNRGRRLCLAIRKNPYWMALSEGEHLGYYRGRRARKWVARYRRPGISSKYREFTIAEADDYADPDGSKILSFGQAQNAARNWFTKIDQSGDQKSRPYSVSNALDDYLEGFSGKDIANTRRRIEAIIRPQIGGHDTYKLTAKIITDWHLALANAPGRLRTAPGAVHNYRQTADTADARRSRRSRANLILTILMAVSNAAYRNEKICDDNA